jgi:hypothetical protein
LSGPENAQSSSIFSDNSKLAIIEDLVHISAESLGVADIVNKITPP